MLLIEDDRTIGQMFKLQLELDRYSVTMVHDGGEALSRILELSPDIVLLDLMLPTVDGLEILQAMQADPRLRSIPVVVLTNYGDPALQARCRSLGVRDYIVKSRTTPAQISNSIPRWMGGESLN